MNKKEKKKKNAPQYYYVTILYIIYTYILYMLFQEWNNSKQPLKYMWAESSKRSEIGTEEISDENFVIMKYIKQQI